MIDYDSATLLYERGRQLMDSGLYDGAAEAFRQSALLAPHFKTYELLGECHLRQSRNEDSIPFLAAAVGLSSRQFRARYLLAQALAAIGDVAGAIEQLQEAIRLHPSYKAARILLEELLNAGKDHPSQAVDRRQE